MQIKDNTVAFYPYTNLSNTYHGMIQNMLSEKYNVIDYNDLKKGLFSITDIEVIYLNWIEDMMTDIDRNIVLKALENGVRIIWVFHNRVSHDSFKRESCSYNIEFLIQHGVDIIILSKRSMSYLYEYVPDLDDKKVHYLPHPNYIGNYGCIENKHLTKKLETKKIVFGSIGNIRKDKNLELLIQAFQKFSRNNKNAALLIAGQAETEEYLEYLINLSEGNNNIIFINENIPDYMLDYYTQSLDAVMLPYDLETSMNSGVMLLAFSNRRTVITSNISMADDFNDKLIYKYTYSNQSEHLEQLTRKMEECCKKGREAVRSQGNQLYQSILADNSSEFVKQKLFQIIGDVSRNNRPANLDSILRIYKDKELWYKRCQISDAFLRNVMEDDNLLDRFKINEITEWAIYGFGKYGKLLYKQAVKEGMLPKCIIDQNASDIHGDIEAYTLDDLPFSLDFVIITTPAADKDTIRKKCCNMNEKCYVLSMGDM